MCLGGLFVIVGVPDALAGHGFGVGVFALRVVRQQRHVIVAEPGHVPFGKIQLTACLFGIFLRGQSHGGQQADLAGSDGCKAPAGAPFILIPDSGHNAPIPQIKGGRQGIRHGGGPHGVFSIHIEIVRQAGDYIGGRFGDLLHQFIPLGSFSQRGRSQGKEHGCRQDEGKELLHFSVPSFWISGASVGFGRGSALTAASRASTSGSSVSTSGVA